MGTAGTPRTIYETRSNHLGHIIGEDMGAPNSRVLISIFIVLAVSGLYAQDAAQPAYLNGTLSPGGRAANLARRMTVEERCLNS